jgi:hypothetical protein
MELRTQVFLLTLFCIGWGALLFAKRIQQSAIRHSKFNPFKEYTRSKTYVWVTRMVGVVAIVIATVIEFLVFTSPH